jgi:hypothetical protein
MLIGAIEHPWLAGFIYYRLDCKIEIDRPVITKMYYKNVFGVCYI